MAFITKYHRLFEVRIFHSFHLKNDTAFYNSTEEDKAQTLIDSNYNILNDLEILPTERTQKLLENYRLRFKASSTGFIVGIETEKSNDNPSQVKPLISIDEGTLLHFRLKIKNTDWSNFTNMSLAPVAKGVYYFNNFEGLSEKQYPSLALKPAAHQSDRNYEMGEIVSSGNTYYQAIKQTDGTVSLTTATNWKNITADFKSYSTDQDRQLLPASFTYRIKSNTGTDIQNINVDLIARDNTVAQSISLSGPNAIEQARLEFNQSPDLYTLSVNSLDGYADVKPIMLDNDLYDPYDWGMIAIIHRPGLGDFRLLESNGDLRIGDSETKHPVFEIRIKNRQTYWKYILHASNVAYAPPANDPDFEKINGQIFTKAPQPLSRFYVEKILPVANKKIPNPTDFLVRIDEGTEKYLSEIRLRKMSI